MIVFIFGMDSYLDVMTIMAKYIKSHHRSKKKTGIELPVTQ